MNANQTPLSPPASPQFKHIEPLQSPFSVAALLGDKLLQKTKAADTNVKRNDDGNARPGLPPTPQPSDSEEDEPLRKKRCVEQCELAKLLLDGTPPPSPEPARVSVIMRANRDGTYSPANLIPKITTMCSQPVPHEPRQISSSQSELTTRQSMTEPENILKSLKFKMSLRKEEIIVNNKNTDRETVQPKLHPLAPKPAPIMVTGLLGSPLVLPQAPLLLVTAPTTATTSSVTTSESTARRRVYEYDLPVVDLWYGRRGVNPGAKERLVQITGTSEDKIHYAKDLIKDTIQRNASPVRLEQGGGEKGAMGGSSSSLNSSASDESNRLQHQQQNSRLRSSLLHSFSTNDASIGEYKYTVTVGNQSLKITGCNLDLVRTAKLVLDEYFLGDSENFTSGIEYFNFEEESPYSISSSSTQKTLLISNNTNEGRELNMDSTATSESEETYKSHVISEPNSSTQEGPYAKRPPADWARIQKECPNIVRKVHQCDTNANHLMYDSVTY
ncbi:hypothetical protein E2986_12697 [Frieseomelitta varia]|uniref:K Homology domain-containing protein n=1 Tax=Frieseomelitta varia TaxID=561572 RepID=A0A833RRG0_9HYME|nr:hypothetical protein E2986_12697 [Frieseomelitta varia]